MFSLAETRLGSGVTGVLNSLTPIFALVTGVLFFGLKFKKLHLIGVLLGCAGIAVLMIGEHDWYVSSYVFFVVLGTFCYGLSANMIKRYCQDIHPFAITAIGFFSLGCFALTLLGYTGGYEKMIHAEVVKESLLPVLILALVCTVMANILFFWLLQRTTAVFGSSIAYAIPCMALIWGGLDGELISWFQIAGFVFIIAAVYTLRRR
jgi:drug/metabolite transporter (DMT)-like permease